MAYDQYDQKESEAVQNSFSKRNQLLFFAAKGG
jgi:hypothetical protein